MKRRTITLSDSGEALLVSLADASGVTPEKFESELVEGALAEIARSASAVGASDDRSRVLRGLFGPEAGRKSGGGDERAH